VKAVQKAFRNISEVAKLVSDDSSDSELSSQTSEWDIEQQ